MNSKLSLFNGLPLTNTEWKNELPQSVLNEWRAAAGKRLQAIFTRFIVS